MDTMNERARASKLAQRECTLLYLLLYLAKSPQTARAIIQDITDEGYMHVYVPRFDLKGKVHPDNASTTAEVFDTVWVRLEAQTSSCHGPTLVVSLTDVAEGLDAGEIVNSGDVADAVGNDDVQDADVDFRTTSSKPGAKPPPAPRLDPIVELLQGISLAPQPVSALSIELAPVIPQRKPHPKLPAALNNAATNLLGKSRTYHQRALRALNQNNQARHDKWHDMAQEASHHAARILEYHYNNK